MAALFSSLALALALIVWGHGSTSSETPSSLESDSVWKWNCEAGRCEKKNSAEGGTSLGVCKLLCGSGTLWPRPTGHVSISQIVVPINRYSLSVRTRNDYRAKSLEPETESLVQEAGKLFAEGLESELEGRPTAGAGKSLIVSLLLDETSFTQFPLEIDESYSLKVNVISDGRVNATIVAPTFLGGRHGLETLGQLIVYDEESKDLVMPSDVTLEDRPLYPYRSLLIDTSRNFISVASIKRTLDAMAANKLNTFHWHITDSQSFPFQSSSHPEFSRYGAYSPHKVYKKEDIKSIIEYARVRGIRVVPELDLPAHVGEGWQWADDTIVCFKAEPWTSYCVEPPCGQLDPTSQKIYPILEALYGDFERAFNPDLFHMGGDEVNLNCWNSTSQLVGRMEEMGLKRDHEGFHQLWSIFQERALGLLEKASGKKRPILIWTSTLTEKGHVDKYLDKEKYIIQIWTKGNDPLIAELVQKGYRIVMSNYDALYFDCGFGAWVGTGNNWCSPYIPWQTVYENDPLKLVKMAGADDADPSLVLGAEATLWTEQADDASIDNRFWPRAAAMAERLWGSGTVWRDAEPRILHQRERLIKRGIMANTIQPSWCYQNQGYCYL